jgi:hypothetical protein
MYPQVQAKITRDDTSIAVAAIDSAVSEAKMWLSKFDLVALFGDEAQDVSATVNDPFLKEIIKAIAVWYLLRLANPNIDMALALTWYEKAVGTLKNIQAGKMQPDGWPYKDTTNDTAAPGNAIYYTPGTNRETRF